MNKTQRLKKTITSTPLMFILFLSPRTWVSHEVVLGLTAVLHLGCHFISEYYISPQACTVFEPDHYFVLELGNFSLSPFFILRATERSREYNTHLL